MLDWKRLHLVELRWQDGDWINGYTWFKDFGKMFDESGELWGMFWGVVVFYANSPKLLAYHEVLVDKGNGKTFKLALRPCSAADSATVS